MITAPAKKDFKSKKRCFGDSAIAYGIGRSKLWGLLITKPFTAFILAIGQYLQFTRAAFSYALISVFRFRFGIQSCGLILSLGSVGIMIIFNSVHIWRIFSPFALFSLTALPFFYDWDTIYRWLFIDIRSQALLIWSGLVLIKSSIHVVMIYGGFGNEDLTKSGVSYAYIGLSKLFAKIRINVSEFVVAVFIESAFAIAMGCVFWFMVEDQTFGLFCFLMAFSEIVIQVKAKTAQLHRQAYFTA